VLLDRRRVKFWQRIVFGGMAFLMAAFLVVGYSGVLNGCTWFDSAQEDVAKTLDAQITKYKTATTTDPTDAAAWISLAEAYISRSASQTQGSQALTSDLTSAAAAYAKADKLLAKQKGAAVKKQRLDMLATLAGVYSQLGDSSAAVQVYGDITGLTPKSADAFFNLGAAASTAGDTTTAMLAFTRFLELDPKSPYAKEVKDWIAANAPQATPTPTPSPTK
jgi:tetratricopeptide (TPR) repeat protein